MKNKRIVYIFIAVMLICCLQGCKKDTVGVSDSTSDNGVTVSVPASTEPASVSEPVSADDTDVTADIETKSIMFNIINMCGGQIGIVAILDPVTGEQMNIGELPPDQVLTVTLDWPVDKTIFDIAFYNVLGDLVCNSEINIEGVSEYVNVMISGEGNIDSVTGEVH